MNNSKTFWNRMAKSYDKQVDKKYGRAYADTITLSKDHLQSDFRVLDFACGTALTTIELSRSVEEIQAIDISKQMIKIAKTKALNEQALNIDFSVCDIFDKKFDHERFDAILAFNILCYFKDHEAVLNRIQKLLKPSGIFLSATDCLGQEKSILITFMIWLSKLGIMPVMNRLTMKSLKNNIQQSGFKILNEQNLYNSPPNYFIAAKKKG